MPLINVKLIEDVFTPEQKGEIVERLTDAMVSIEGENMRGVTSGRQHHRGRNRHAGDVSGGAHRLRARLVGHAGAQLAAALSCVGMLTRSGRTALSG